MPEMSPTFDPSRGKGRGNTVYILKSEALKLKIKSPFVSK